MDKTEVRSFIESLEPGDTIDIRLLGSLESFSGKYLFSTTKVGRGKNGSLLAVLKSVDDPENVVNIGTPQSDSFMSLTREDGTTVGTKFEHEVPALYKEENSSFAMNVNNAVKLKELFAGHLDVGATDAVKTVEIQSLVPSLNGTFTLTDVSKLRGRHGQIVVTMENSNNETIQFSTLTHSGMIQRISVNG